FRSKAARYWASRRRADPAGHCESAVIDVAGVGARRHVALVISRTRSTAFDAVRCNKAAERKAVIQDGVHSAVTKISREGWRRTHRYEECVNGVSLGQVSQQLLLGRRAPARGIEGGEA